MRLSGFDVAPPATNIQGRRTCPGLVVVPIDRKARRRSAAPGLLPRQARALSTRADLAGVGGRTDEARALAAGADLAGVGDRTDREARALSARANLAGI